MVFAVAVRSVHDSMRVGYGRVIDPVLGFLSGSSTDDETDPQSFPTCLAESVPLL